MKVFNICQKHSWKLEDGTLHEWVAKHPIFDEQKAHERLEFLQPHYNNELWLEESEEVLHKFADNVYIPEQIKFGEQMCNVKIEDDRVKILIVGKWVDITSQMKFDIIGLKRFNKFQELCNECWNGRNKYIVNECVLDEVHMYNNGTFMLEYVFTCNSYLDRRKVIGGTWTIEHKANEGSNAHITMGCFNSLISVNVYW